MKHHLRIPDYCKLLPQQRLQVSRRASVRELRGHVEVAQQRLLSREGGDGGDRSNNAKTAPIFLRGGCGVVVSGVQRHTLIVV